MGASASLGQRIVSVDPGSEASVQIRVRNTGQVVDQFALQVLGGAAGWASVEPPVVSLFPGREEAATVWFRPPRASTVPAGDLPFAVRVTSHEDPEGSAVEEGGLRIGVFRQTAAELSPKNSRGIRSGTHELAVDNRGNTSIVVSVNGVDPDGVLRFRSQPPTLTIGPGRAGFTRLRVTARQLFLSGPPRPHPFQLQVLPDGEAPLPLDGSMVQVPLVGPWLRRAALAAVVAGVALVALWFLVVKPAVVSAAKSTVAAPLAQQSAAIAALQRQVSPGGGGSGAATPTPGGGAATPPPGGGGGAGGGAGTSFARRLDAGHSQYKVPAGTALSITDVVFQNPNGEHGTVALQRDGTTLLIENLDNFRDLDYHFVTPIGATANQTIELSITCAQNGCANPSSVGIYLNGSEKPG